MNNLVVHHVEVYVELRVVSLWEDTFNLIESQFKSLIEGISNLLPKLGLLSFKFSPVRLQHDLFSGERGDGGLLPL